MESKPFKVKNSLNKLNTGLKMGEKLAEILLDESIRGALAISKGKAKDHFKDLPSNLIFKMGLAISGTKLSERFAFKTKHVKDAQLRTLMSILRENMETQFAKDHNFSEIKTLEDFRKNVPVQTYDTLALYINQHIHGKADILVKGKPVSYATTSGTTGEPKYIPITERAKKTSHKNVSRLWTHSITTERPDSLQGKILAIASAAEEGKTPDGTSYGSASGQLVRGLPKVIQKKFSIPYEVLAIENYTAKYYGILLLGMQDNVTFLSTANPSTLSLIANKGNEWREDLLNDIEKGTIKEDIEFPVEVRKIIAKRIKPNPKLADQLRASIAADSDGKLRPKHYWPNLVMIACWTGGNSNTFIRTMKEWYGNITIRDMGYLASEIRGSVPLTSDSSAGALTITENFFEFVHINKIEDPEPEFLTCDQLVKGEQYYIFFTTRAGLYRYNINDIVEVKGFVNATPTIVFVQKGKGVTNITGEKLYEQQLIAAIKKSEEFCDTKVNFFMAIAKMTESKYDLYVEFEDRALTLDMKRAFLNEVENNLQEINIEYKAKRSSLRLPPLTLHDLEQGSFETFKKWRISQGIREAQFKPVPLTADIKLSTPLTILETICL